MYDNGEGIPENDAEAVKWYRKAADQGYAKAQYNLGVMYCSGDGVPENDVKFMIYAKKSGNEEYQRVLNKLLSCG